MIIITENKKQHYLIKNFLKEIDYFVISESLRSDQGGEHTALNIKSFDLDKEIITQDTPVDIQTLQKAAIKKPKMRKLINLVKKGVIVTFLAASTYFGMQGGDSHIAHQVADSNQISYEQVLKDMNPKLDTTDTTMTNDKDFEDFDKKLSLSIGEKDINKARVEREYDGEGITSSTHHNSVYNFEGFRDKSYPDAGGLSIGYGIQLFKDSSNKKGKTWQEVFFGEKLGLEIKGKGKNKFIIRNSIRTKLNKIKSITEAEGKIATDKDIPERINLMYSVYPWAKELPRDVQLAFLDMTYNMGMWFKMTGFKGNLKTASSCIANSNFKMAIEYLKTAKQELKYFVTPEVISYEDSKEEIKYSGYALQGDKALPVKGENIHRRANNSLERIDNGILVLQKHINKTNKTNESYSIRSIYSHLFS